MSKMFNTVLSEIKRGENLDLYLTIVLAVVIAVLGIFQVAKFEVVSAVTLAILGLLASSLLTARRLTVTMKESFEKIQRAGHISDLLTSAYPDFTKRLRTAKSVSIEGSTLMSTVQRYSAEFNQLLQRGGSLRVLVSEPSPEVLAMQLFRSSSIKDPTVMADHIQSNIAMMKSLAGRVSHPSLFEIRIMPYLASYSLAVIDDNDGTSKVYVKLLPFQRSEPESPTFEVDSHYDPEWFEFFRDQFERMWASSKQV